MDSDTPSDNSVQLLSEAVKDDGVSKINNLVFDLLDLHLDCLNPFYFSLHLQFMISCAFWLSATP